VGAVAAPLTSIFFGLTVVGVTTFMSLFLVVAAVLGFVALRKEKPGAH
jgi:hypothetical protein